MPLATRVSPFNAPNYDLFAPARRSDERGVVLGAALDGGQSYVPWIGLSTVRELALKYPDQVGLVDVDLLIDANVALSRAELEIQALKLQVADLEAKQERIAGLVADGYKVQRVMGRPKKSEE